jgi:hypothetical protein
VFRRHVIENGEKHCPINSVVSCFPFPLAVHHAPKPHAGVVHIAEFALFKPGELLALRIAVAEQVRDVHGAL